jgi:opacity protein-like surface antigen
MATIFPGSASVNQEFDGYRFNGTSWDIIGIDLTADYLETSVASATYLNKVSASTTYLTQTSASTTYATKASPTFTGTMSSPTINATTKYQKNGTDITSIAYADISVSAQQGENTYLLNLPAGVTNANFVSISPVSGVNNYLMITGFALGDWSGVQTSSQIRVRCFLGNGVHLEAFTLRVYYRV